MATPLPMESRRSNSHPSLCLQDLVDDRSIGGGGGGGGGSSCSGERRPAETGMCSRAAAVSCMYADLPPLAKGASRHLRPQAVMVRASSASSATPLESAAPWSMGVPRSASHGQLLQRPVGNIAQRQQTGIRATTPPLQGKMLPRENSPLQQASQQQMPMRSRQQPQYPQQQQHQQQQQQQQQQQHLQQQQWEHEQQGHQQERLSGGDASPPGSPKWNDGHLRDPMVAESYGREILGQDPWPEKVFQYTDGGDGTSIGYLLPAEFAMLNARLQEHLGPAPRGKRFLSRFVDADTDRDGRVSIEEWEAFAGRMERAYGTRRCKRAAMRLLGARKAENRILKANVCVFSGYNHEASLLLLRSCAKWNSAHLVETISRALEKKADPNCALSTPSFNGYTPLIFLSMAQPIAMAYQVTKGIDTLIAAKAEVHRENDDMPFGRWPPLRFAAQLQNRAGVVGLLRHVDVGETFSWAAGEAVEFVMVDELRKLCGTEVCKQITLMNTYNLQASVLMQLFASSIVGGNLTPAGAKNLISGTYEVWSLSSGQKADPNFAGLEGMTALMHVILKGDVACVEALLANKSDPNQRDSTGATPLHFAARILNPDIAKSLLHARASPHIVDQAGFSAWMLVGEERTNCIGAVERSYIQELLEMLRPALMPERIMDAIEEGKWVDLLGGERVDVDVLKRRWRMRESLFFDHRIVRRGAHEGRELRHFLVSRAGNIIIDLLKKDPLKGEQKILAKYLLQATIGPKRVYGCEHVKFPWEEEDNRNPYRTQLTETATMMLKRFGGECGVLRRKIQAAADEWQAKFEEESEPATPSADGRSLRRAFDEPSAACNALFDLPFDEVSVPKEWQKVPFWQAVQERQLLRFDPAWAASITGGAACCLALLRLGAIGELSQYVHLVQVKHATMQELQARGYVKFSELCNEPFQRRLREIAERVAQREGLDVRPPEGLVKAKQLKRLMEKTMQAKEEFADVEWPGMSREQLESSYCFHILDTVRLSFTCAGPTLADQVVCCMKLLDEFNACTPETDGLCVLRQKSGFSPGAASKGGYADVKMLMYADLGTHVAFDGTEIPLRIVGEVQLILEDYMNVKNRMHLVYEVDRGSFDNERVTTVNMSMGPRRTLKRACSRRDASQPQA
eukprot:TRINITY_DN17840_c4_g1_i1.p1 TRINITY_DN17840_c4_g1~~TRINITY_DN17840_c4_g1_i1.p1  ORF type:complete len:1168 (-),score=272.09 TRINITY_DN17840_c4_g1_i1:106-3522(-)